MNYNHKAMLESDGKTQSPSDSTNKTVNNYQ